MLFVYRKQNSLGNEVEDLLKEYAVKKALITVVFFAFAVFMLYTVICMQPFTTPGASLFLPNTRIEANINSEVENQTSVNINNINGNIKVSSWDSNVISLRIVRRAAGFAAQSKLKGLVDQINIGLDKTSDKIDIRAEEVIGLKGPLWYSVDLDIKLPAGLFNVSAKTEKGNIALDTVGSLKKAVLTVKNGDVSVHDIRSGRFELQCDAGKINIDSVKGDISIIKKKGSVSLSDVTGNISIKSQVSAVNIKNTSGTINTDISSGSIRAEMVSLLAPSSFYTTSGDMYIKASSFDKSGEYELNSSSGNIRLLVPSGTGFSLRARSNNGRVTSNYSIAEGYNKPTKNEMAGYVNDGGPDIDAYVFRGNISVDKY